MPNHRNCLILLAVLATALGLQSVLVAGRSHPPARWPRDDAFFEVGGWSVTAEQADVTDNGGSWAVLVQRTYVHLSTSTSANLVMWSNPQPEARALFRKGPDRDYLGDGYVTEAAPTGLLAATPGGGAIIARRGEDAWLLVYMFGERRGALGNGPTAWAFGELDALLDRPNDYFLARLGIPYQAAEPPPGALADQLAAAMFPRLTDWYSRV